MSLWASAISGISSLIDSWFKVKKAKAEAEAKSYQMQVAGEIDWDVQAQKNAQYSWKDEFITIVWFTPLIVAWFDPDKAMKWVEFVSELPYFYQIGMFGIICASFGLRWYFKQQAFTVIKK